jgi:hypothetical protein
MRPPRPALTLCSTILGLVCVSRLVGGQPLPAPLPAGNAPPSAPTQPTPSTPVLPPPMPIQMPTPYPDPCACPDNANQAPCATCLPCPSSPNCQTPKVIVELSQPEIHFAAPCRASAGSGAGPCQREQPAKESPKSCSLFNISINKVKSRSFGGGATGQPVTTVVPAFATATIPIAFQTTRTTTVGTELGQLGTRETARADLEDMVREAVRRETAKQPPATEAAPQRDGCAELKGRMDKVEQRLDQIEKQVQGIVTKIDKLAK